MTAFEIVQLILRIGLALLFVPMGVIHFRPKIARAMASMIPPWITRGNRRTGANLVAFTGVCEIAGAIGILIPATSFLAGILLVIFLIAVFPANHYASQNREKFGRVAVPFWPRYVAQLLLIAVILVAIA